MAVLLATQLIASPVAAASPTDAGAHGASKATVIASQPALTASDDPGSGIAAQVRIPVNPQHCKYINKKLGETAGDACRAAWLSLPGPAPDISRTVTGPIAKFAKKIGGAIAKAVWENAGKPALREAGEAFNDWMVSQARTAADNPNQSPPASRSPSGY